MGTTWKWPPRSASSWPSRWGSTSWSASPDSSTWATWRSSPSVPTRGRSSARRTPTCCSAAPAFPSRPGGSTRSCSSASPSPPAPAWCSARPPLPLEVSYAVGFYFLALLIVVVVILVNRRLEDSHIGRAWEAIREDQLAAQAMGVPLVRAKLLAFASGASFAGVMGVVFSAKQVFINPESFTFLESIGVLAMVILGGMGSIPGAIVGATVVTVLNLQVLKGLSLWLNELKNAGVTIFGYNLANLPTQLEPAKYERMIFGLILVLMMIFRPQGIFPARRRQRELGEQ
ncbi:MAG: hypothetical protein DMD85_01195 [Candidatus Rokuibacteriota bacterium]|nr:MAG: hypothetical protein DMD85_01195 [Candidatus Rokubacteria bacterium]